MLVEYFTVSEYVSRYVIPSFSFFLPPRCQEQGNGALGGSFTVLNSRLDTQLIAINISLGRVRSQLYMRNNASDIYRYPVFFLRKLVYPASGSRDRICIYIYIFRGTTVCNKQRAATLLQVTPPILTYTSFSSCLTFASENRNWNRAILARSRANQAGGRGRKRALGSRPSLWK